MKRRIGCLGLGLFALAMAVGVPIKSYALDDRYLRNGECYLLIGEGDNSLKGIYRLNNPAKTTPAFYDPIIKVLGAGDVKNTLGFDVDLDRKIYTFTEKVASSWSKDPAPLYRQVIDNSVSNDDADYGYHAWIHYDHRSWGANTNIYRSGAVGRNIKNDYGGVWSGFKGAGQGTLSAKPSGYTMPTMSGAASLGEYSGKSWYQIPNESWYSCWKTGSADPYWNGKYKFYYVMGDKAQAKYHDYYLYKWLPKNINADNPGYGRTGGGGFVEGSPVAQTKELKVSREIKAGCLDGCGGATGSGSSAAASKISDTAFQPPLKNGSDRTYFYSRSEGQSDWSIQLNAASYPRSSSDELIGDPASTDTYWLDISLKDDNSDYVYAMGTTTIKDWYKLATGESLGNSKISAICASNQWDEKGGIIYAYDKTKKMVYKFERDETSFSNPLGHKGAFESYEVSGLLNDAGADNTMELDDIGADGFGSLFFAISHPALNPNSYNPKQHFKITDAIDIKKVSSSNNNTNFQLLYKQAYSKAVYTRNYLSSKITRIGKKDFAHRYYNLTVRVSNAGWSEISGIGKNFSKLPKLLASYSAEITTKNSVSEKITDEGQVNQLDHWSFIDGKGNFTGYADLNLQNPGQAQIAVINVPTPPQVVSLGDKKSYMDIIGPYDGSFPQPDPNKLSTNQDQGYDPARKPEIGKLYWYMLENYPLAEGAVNPQETPDWDNDGRWGGFISSIVERAPKSNDTPEGVEYYWATWQVMDLFGNPCLELIQHSTEHAPYNYFMTPVYGKFIMTCGVRYKWYDYDKLEFGSTVRDLNDPKVKKQDWAVAVKQGFANLPTVEQRLAQIGIQNASSRLAEIKAMPAFQFMNNPVDEDGKTLSLNYSDITKFVDEKGNIGGEMEFLAMEPVDLGVASGSPTPTDYVTLIARCDEIPGYSESNYLPKNEYWEPSANQTFGIEAGQGYYWRIDIASQTNLFRDIEKCNDITNPTSSNYNFVAKELITSGSPMYANSNIAEKGEFKNRVGDVKWISDKIYYSAKLLYKAPDGTTYKEIPMALSVGSAAASSTAKAEYTGNVEVVPQNPGSEWIAVSANQAGNTPIYVKTNSDLPPTDPYTATLEISMYRPFIYKVDTYQADGTTVRNSQIVGGGKILQLTGKAEVLIVDTSAPKFDLAKTNTNNIFGETGQYIRSGVGPDSNHKNPENIQFVVTTKNPWDAVFNESAKGIELKEHLENYEYNYGSAALKNYAGGYSGDSQVNQLYQPMSGNNIKGIQQLIAEGKSKRPTPEPTSKYNLKRVYSMWARDVRFGYDTAFRSRNGKVEVVYAGENGKGSEDALNNAISFGRDFGSDDISRNYFVNHWHTRNLTQKYLTRNVTATSYVQHGTTDVYSGTIGYQLPVNQIKMGGADGRIPEFYANNTPGYKPYRFFVKAVDGSGNVTVQQLNLHLNVIDTLAPVGYGIVTDKKKEAAQDTDAAKMTFPYKTKLAANAGGTFDTRLKQFGMANEYYDQRYIGAVNDIATASMIADNDADGYIRNQHNGKTDYQALKSLGSEIVTGISSDNQATLIAQIKNGLSPLPVEDNVECVFEVGCTDNCGAATATMKVKYYATRDAGDASDLTVTSNYMNAQINSDSSIASNTMRATTVFKGKSEMFPMAIPVSIETIDNAKNYDYFVWDQSLATFTTYVGGASKPNKRTFNTTLPVLGSGVSIRTIDRSTTNDNKNR